MGLARGHTEATQHDAPASALRPRSGSSGISIAPPGYGIDFVDRQQRGADAIHRLHGAEEGVVQAFWVKEGGADPLWESDETKKKNYTETKQTWWNMWHWSATPIFVPAFDTMMKQCTDQKVSFKTRMEIAVTYYPAGLTIDMLQPFIGAASQAERNSVWQDKGLMAQAKTNLTLDTYLALLPALGVFNPPTGKIAEATGKWTSHLPAQEADRHIGTYLTTLGVNASAIAGRKVEGEVSIVDEADWLVAFKRQWGTTYAPTVANAFVDVNLPKRHIWIHKDRGNAGTIIHEGMHKYADPTLRDDLILTHHPTDPISQLDEGITEYFTRKVTVPLGISRGNYADPHAVATQLVATVGEKTVADAYFEGKFADLKSRYLSVKGGTWDSFAGAVESKKWSDALKYL
jgi:hypothetical protein